MKSEIRKLFPRFSRKPFDFHSYSGHTHGKFSRLLIPSLRLDVTEMSIPSSGLRSTEDFSEDYSIRPCWIGGACSKLRASGIIVLLNSLIDWMMWTLHFDLNEVMLVMV